MSVVPLGASVGICSVAVVDSSPNLESSLAGGPPSERVPPVPALVGAEIAAGLPVVLVHETDIARDDADAGSSRAEVLDERGFAGPLRAHHHHDVGHGRYTRRRTISAARRALSRLKALTQKQVETAGGSGSSNFRKLERWCTSVRPAHAVIARAMAGSTTSQNAWSDSAQSFQSA